MEHEVGFDAEGEEAEIFDLALDLQAADRAAYLDTACHGDVLLRARVEELLRLAEESHGDWPFVAQLRQTRRAAQADAAENQGTVNLASGSQDETAWAALLEQLRGRGQNARYVLRGEVGRGGMGVVYRVYDLDVRRPLAMKVIRDSDAADHPYPSPAVVDDRTLGRFLEEAQITGQLDHPGIVPVHEVGIDGQGRVYFTMKLVKGDDLRTVIEQVHAAKDPKVMMTRTLGALLRVCEAVSYAHAKGVIHRDLKPGNIMVGRFGEVYVMDWGLARVLDQGDGKDIRLRVPQPESESALHSERRDRARSDDALCTMDGDVVGTPAYMPEEQASGRIDEVGVAADIYAMGAILYHLLSGHMPYVKPGDRVSNRTLLAMVKHAAPPAIEREAPNAPPELHSICRKAMARRVADRYATMEELGDELRAFLENRVVKAHATGAWAELRKWVTRNRSLAALAAGLLVTLLTSGLVLAVQNTQLMHAQNEAEENLSRYDRLSGVVKLEDARAAEQDLYPPWPQKAAAMRHWLDERLGKLLDLERDLRDTVIELEASATLDDRPAVTATPLQIAEQEELAQVEAGIANLQAILNAKEGARPALRAVELPPVVANNRADELISFAWSRVAPEDGHRKWGQEPVALQAALTARQLVDAGDDSTALPCVLRVLAWALLANQRPEEALRAAEDARAAAAAYPHAHSFYDRELAALRSAIVDQSGYRQQLARLSHRRDRLESILARAHFVFSEESLRFLHDRLLMASDGIRELAEKEGRQVAERLEWANRIDALTRNHPRAHVTWDEARDAILAADDVRSSHRYAAVPIDLVPQIGLVPIGMNPQTRLWEFYDLRSAHDPASGIDPATIEIPRHRADGTIEVRDDTGVVFVLMPGGVFRMGAQNDSESQPCYDAAAQPDERPLHDLPMAPFFIARHELTMGQWYRLSGGEEPSRHRRGAIYRGDVVPIGWTHPVNQVAWGQCLRLGERSGLQLPTEAQWEYAARAGTDWPWWAGTEPSSLADAENVLDRHGDGRYPGWGSQVGDFDDGFADIAPVGLFRPNAFGLHDVQGNVWEWCLDVSASYSVPPQPGNGLRTEGIDEDVHIYRGGAFTFPATIARVAYRNRAAPSVRNFFLGVRFVRELTSPPMAGAAPTRVR